MPPLRIAVLDYGSGNLASAVRALKHAGETAVAQPVSVELTESTATAGEADGLVVPGVGAYAACMAGLVDVGGPELIAGRRASGLPTLGICVGFQVMFDAGDEHGVHTRGCGIWPGTVERLRSTGVPIPHMGWNQVAAPSPSRLFGDSDDRYYFVHSYAAHDQPLTRQSAAVVSTCAYGGDTFVAAAESADGMVAGTQFHPEKSGAAGLALLGRWIRLVAQIAG